MTLQAAPVVDTRVRKRVLVVDDSFITRNVVRQIVESDPDLEVVDTAENGVVALEKVRRMKPDVVLLDIEMPEMSGLETLRQLGLRSPCKVVILSNYVGKAHSAERTEALRLGAVAAIAKPSGSAGLDLRQMRESNIVTVLRKTLASPLADAAPDGAKISRFASSSRWIFPADGSGPVAGRKRPGAGVQSRGIAGASQSGGTTDPAWLGSDPERRHGR